MTPGAVRDSRDPVRMRQAEVVFCARALRGSSRLTNQCLGWSNPMDEGTDGSLVRRAAAGNRDAFAELLERHYDRVYRVAVRVLGDPDEAADLAQDVCVGLPAKLATWRGESRFETWLYRVVVNAARDALRRKAVRQRSERGYAELDALERSGDDDGDCASAWLRRALGLLSDDLRMTVSLVLEEGLRHAEAGEVLGVSESTVSWRMHEARKRLRALAAEAEDVR